MKIDYTQAKKEVEAVRRSGRTNMLAKNTVKKLAVECDLPSLATFLIELDDREVDTPNKGDYMPLLEEAAEEWRGVDNDEIKEMADRVRNEKVMVEL